MTDEQSDEGPITEEGLVADEAVDGPSGPMRARSFSAVTSA